MFKTSRRRVLQGAGVGAAGLIAGCLGEDYEQASTGNKNQSQNMNSTNSNSMTKEQAKKVDVDRVAADPTDIPDPIERDEPKEVNFTMRPEEVTAEIEDGVTFDYMTYNGQVPGPMVRVRKGDTVNLTFENPTENAMQHNVDFHAVAGPGGGAGATMTSPGETAHLKFKATYPGAYIYHCAVPNLDMHISAGMFGIILVEPEDGMPEVDHEFYFGQHEIYTDKGPGDKGHHKFDMDAMMKEEPTYVLINGEKYAITPKGYGPAKVETGDKARVFFVTGGPNLTSSFHPIGNVWEELYPEGSLTTDPETHIQTKPVAPGSCTIATMNFPVPGNFKLVDHSLTRVARKGCMAIVRAEGEERPEIFDPNPKS